MYQNYKKTLSNNELFMVRISILKKDRYSTFKTVINTIFTFSHYKKLINFLNFNNIKYRHKLIYLDA